jgi:hypothetical protein
MLALAVQTVAAIWWAASLSSKVEALEKSVATTHSHQAFIDAKQDAESLRAEARISAQIDRIAVKIDRMVENPR